MVIRLIEAALGVGLLVWTFWYCSRKNKEHQASLPNLFHFEKNPPPKKPFLEFDTLAQPEEKTVKLLK